MSATMLMDIMSEFPLRSPMAIFFAVLGIILVVPLLFNRLKIPYIIGLIIAGMIVGPYGLNILARDDGFEVFGQVGLLYLMFLAGVEINMYHLQRNYRQGVLYGLLTFIIPFIVGFIATYWLLHADILASVLVASMFASHTLVSYPIITRFGLSNSKGVVIAVCGTIITVLLALIVLAEVVNIKLHGGFYWRNTVWLLIKLLIYVAVFGKCVPWITRIFFRKVNDAVTQFVYVLAMVFLFATVAQIIGVAAILGAFYAGLVLNRFIPARSALMGRIEFVGNAIFIPYFLIGVGMLINMKVAISGWGVLYAGLVMTVPALGSKWLASFIAQKVMHLSRIEGGVMLGLSAGKAAATIAATMIGYDLGIITEEMMNGAVLMILGCCVAAGIVTQASAIRLRMVLTREDLREDSKYKQQPARPLLSVSHPVTALDLLKLTVLMSGDRKKTPVSTLYVLNSDDPTRREMGKNVLQIVEEGAAALDVRAKTVMRYDMNIVAGIVNVAKEQNSSEIVLGLHRQTTVIDTFLGPVLEKLARATNRMIVMSRCFIPLNTVQSLKIFVPPKAEYETGFRVWVNRIGNLTRQLGCHAEFISTEATIPYLRGAIEHEKGEYNYSFQTMQTWDDFIILSSRITIDDLFVVIGARRSSISFGAELEAMPAYLSKYFSQHNLLIIYPEQFGDQQEMPTPLDALAHDSSAGTGTSIFAAERWGAVSARLSRLFHHKEK